MSIVYLLFAILFMGLGAKISERSRVFGYIVLLFGLSILFHLIFKH